MKNGRIFRNQSNLVARVYGRKETIENRVMMHLYFENLFSKNA